MSETLDKLVKETHEGKVVYHGRRQKRGRERGEAEAREAEKGERTAYKRRKYSRAASAWDG
jgi:hypothetical protein